MESYDQFPNVVWPLSDVDPTDHEPEAFVYVDYNIDTFYVEDRPGVNRIIAPYLGKVQHLAFAAQPPTAFTKWAMLKRDCPMLKDITFIDLPDGFRHKHDEEWRLVDVPADFGPAITLPQLDDHGHYIDERLVKAVDDHGNLALFGAEVKETLEDFAKPARDQAGWKNISLKIAIVAQRKIDSLPWRLIYPVWDVIPNYWKDVRFHWHEEPVLLGDGAITSCRPALHPNRLCDDCRRQRWLQFNDAFWISKGEGEEDNRSGRPHDSSAGSAGYMTDEEPENDIEEVTENASEDSDDNIETFTEEESDELAERY
jgi:hypothetical protein